MEPKYNMRLIEVMKDTLFDSYIMTISNPNNNIQNKNRITL